MNTPVFVLLAVVYCGAILLVARVCAFNRLDRDE